MNNKKIPIAKPLIGEEEKFAVTNVLDSGMLASGQKVLEFEKLFGNENNGKNAVAVSSGTAALQIALMAHGIGKNLSSIDEVITTPFTFIATANSILWAGGRPVFADIDEETFNIDPNSISEKVIKGKTKAILPVHLYGLACNMKSIMEIAEDYNLVVIEDACQAVGLKHGIGYGTACYSFYPTKNITTGEGGMIVCNDHNIAERCRLIRSHGARPENRYSHEILGYNFRMTDICAAIGIEQFKKLDTFNKMRRENAAYMSSRLNRIDGIVIYSVENKEQNKKRHVFNQYTIRIKNGLRDKIKKLLNDKGIGAEIYYPIPIYKQPLYKDLGYNDILENAEMACEEVLSLPIYPGITKEDMDSIIDIIISGIKNE